MRACAFNPDGSLLASASQDGTVRLWNPASGEEVRRLTCIRKGEQTHAVVTDCAFNPDGSLLATASGDNTARLWPVAVTD